jgi:hypothetical protein
MQLNIDAELFGTLGQQGVVTYYNDRQFVVSKLQAEIRTYACGFARSNGERSLHHLVPLRYSTVARSRN